MAKQYEQFEFVKNTIFKLVKVSIIKSPKNINSTEFHMFRFFPYFGIFVIMFFDIFKTVAKVSVLIALFIAAFSLGFNILLIEQVSYRF